MKKFLFNEAGSIAKKIDSCCPNHLTTYRGADVDFKNRNGQSALIVAIGSRMEEISHLLIDRGADVTIKDSLGMTAAGYAKLFSMNEIYEKLESIV